MLGRSSYMLESELSTMTISQFSRPNERSSSMHERTVIESIDVSFRFEMMIESFIVCLKFERSILGHIHSECELFQRQCPSQGQVFHGFLG